MFCEAYDQSLRDAAASNEALSPVLRRHLASCESCRAAFAEEQSLFTAVDLSLHTVANSEVPSTLIPRVRVALNNEPARQSRGYSFLAWGSASLLLTAAIVLAVLYLPSNHRPTLVVPSRPSPAVAAKNSQDRALNPARPNGVSTVQHKKPVVLVANRGSKPKSPEVLVPDEERIAFAQFMVRVSPSSANILASAALVPRAPKDSVQISPVEIASLEPRPLDQQEGRQGQF